jgi:tRNA dimethylallyltransferase
MVKTVHVIVGPTASGKTGAAIELAKRINGEIISADSVQVYRGLDIGSGKISDAEMQGIPHHLIDVANPGDDFSVEDFRQLGNKAIEKIISQNKVPIITGGTGFYIDTLVNNTKYAKVDLEVKKNLKNLDIRCLNKQAVEVLPAQVWQSFDNQNPARVRNRLGLWLTHGQIPKQHKIKRGTEIKFAWLGLNPGKSDLKKRIVYRTKSRIENGLVDEVKNLISGGVSPDWLRSIGLTYRSVVEHLETKTSVEDLRKNIIQAELRYAKRQLTWFKRNEEIKWFPSKVKLLNNYSSNH